MDERCRSGVHDRYRLSSEVKSRISLCTRRLVSADSSPLTVVGWINLDVVFPGLQCNMCCVVASIGSDGLLGTEALQSCLPHQLDLRTGQLWAEGRSTLQLHQQKPTPDVTGLLLTAVVLPPDSEVVASFSINGGLLGSCALIDPNRDLAEEFGVVVGHTLVDTSTPSANVLIINPNVGRSSVAMRFTCRELGPRVSCVGGPVGITVANKYGSSTTRLLGRHCRWVTYFPGRYQSSVTTRFASLI